MRNKLIAFFLLFSFPSTAVAGPCPDPYGNLVLYFEKGEDLYQISCDTDDKCDPQCANFDLYIYYGAEEYDLESYSYIWNHWTLSGSDILWESYPELTKSDFSFADRSELFWRDVWENVKFVFEMIWILVTFQ